MRKLIAAMKISIDGKMEGPEGVADWVDGWSDDYGLMSQIDACVLGAGMYPGYEAYWSAITNAPNQPLPMTGKLPTRAELEWAHFAEKTPHYVLSRTLKSVQWPKTRFLRGVDELAKLKQHAGKDIYLIGGARTTAGLIDAGLVDELRLISYPLIAGKGKPLFTGSERRRGLALRNVQQLDGGRLSMIYAID
jgi:dihydrofolate reductase